mmetsp:Transcript_10786/g.24642  ORF Transcript_10786/g.24642 Transcript_10786/m.24642 type:complete len:519 (-) Transcript_10786:121-1677(-)|eukprot:CAMPEP_0178374218 /NCGR_PEP_ID=MMETSP0689_2-20121128/2264_1 /TAXON_ID=160604 /ORGANISM="Amphidinium massartii, Strain CS-259" /LENGTH=518 /DNA_ID=CAMNT_0019994183 /DNA_START=12 /DNA_END=1568 /DNA_ORIENTATION=+
MAGFFTYLSIAFSTILSTYPSILIVQTLAKEEPEHFQPCSDGCLFVRFFSSGSLPSTQVMNLDATRDSMWPAYALIENGRNISFHSWSLKEDIWNPTTWVPNLLGIFYTYGPMALINAKIWGQQSYPSPVVEGIDGDIDDFCDSKDMRAKIHNHLSEGIGRMLYVVGLLGWALLKIVHDFMLLSEVPERHTLWVGISSWFFELLAAVCGLLWSMGAMGVFVAVVDHGSSACYYQLGGLESILALVAPAPLVYLTVSKLGSLMLSVQFGDYLYATQYDVPYRVASATLPDKTPTGSLLVAGIVGADTTRSAPDHKRSHKLEHKDLKLMCTGFVLCNLLLALAVGAVLTPFVAGPFIVKVVVLLIGHGYGVDSHGIAKVALVAVFWIMSLHHLQAATLRLPALASSFFSDLKWNFGKIVSLVVLTLAPTLAAPFTFMTLVNLPLHELLQQSWLCVACGFVLAFSAFGLALRKLTYDIQRGLTIRVQGPSWKESEEELEEFLKEHPHWELEASFRPQEPQE